MQFFTIFLSLLLSFQVLGNDLSELESNRLSNDLDNSCGDSWCEGDFNWSVDNFNCSFVDSTCTVDLTLIEEFDFANLEYCSSDEILGTSDIYCLTSEQVEQRYSSLAKILDVDMDADYMTKNIRWTQSCTISNVTSRDSLFDDIDLSQRPYDYAFSLFVYESVLDCVTEIEEAYWSAADSL